MKSKKATALRSKAAGAVAGVLAAATLSMPLCAYAEPVYMSDGGYFDAEYYAATYPDVAQAVGTDPEALYQHYLTAGKAEGRQPYYQLTDAEIYEKALSMQSTYPEGMAWSYQDYADFRKGYVHNHGACGGFAFKMSDAVFGVNAPYTFIFANQNYVNEGEETAGGSVPFTKTVVIQPITFDQIQVGDILRYASNRTADHYVFVIGKTDTTITVCEGNYGGTVHWGRVENSSNITELKTIVRRE